MVSDEPREDRCGATVVSKIGLEVTDRDMEVTYTSDEDLVGVVLEHPDDGVEEECDTELQDVRKYVLSSGFRVARVELDDIDDGTQWVEIQDADARISNADTEFDGYCERYQMDNGRCYVHGGASDDMEGNSRAMTHGLYVKRSKYYKQLEKPERVEIERLVESWIDDAPFDKENRAKVNELYRIAIDQIRLWKAQDEFMDGIVYDQYEDMDMDGDEIYVPKENPANLPYDRLDRTTYKKLKELGCLDDPESQQAEATESLAEKFDDISDD